MITSNNIITGKKLVLKVKPKELYLNKHFDNKYFYIWEDSNHTRYDVVKEDLEDIVRGSPSHGEEAKKLLFNYELAGVED